MKETKGRRRKRLFAGMTLTDLKWIKAAYKPGEPLPKHMKPEELDAEIKRREKIAAGMVNQPRAGGRFAAAAKEHPKRPEETKPIETLQDRIHKAFAAADKGWGKAFEDRIRNIIREELELGIAPLPRTIEFRNILRQALGQIPERPKRGLWQRLFGWPK